MTGAKLRFIGRKARDSREKDASQIKPPPKRPQKQENDNFVNH